MAYRKSNTIEIICGEIKYEDFQENVFENVGRKMAATLCPPQYVNVLQ